MAPIVSSSKALARLMSGKNRALDFGRGLGLLGNCGENKRQFGRLSQTRISGSIARVGNSSVGGLVGTFRDPASSIGYLQRNAQTRRFLGCGDGEERGVLSKVNEERQVTFRDPASSIGYLQRNAQTRRFLGCGDGEERGVLSKVYEERQVMGYSPEQLFSVVASVDLYEDFVPWCQRSKVIRRYDDGSFDAELEIGFKFLVESYISHVELRKPRYIKTTASESMLFDHLINIWEFNPGPVPGTCELYFLVDFKFQSPLYRQVASMFFKEVVSRLVSSFSERCHRIYGPAVTVLENTYGQSR